jgi:hypothetical protein
MISNVLCKWQSGLLSHPIPNKENILIATQPQRTRRPNWISTPHHWGKCSIEYLDKTKDAIESEHTILRETKKYWHVLLTTLLDHLNGKHDQGNKGHKCVPRRKRCSNEGLNTQYARMWTFYNLV